jgi:histidinol dehydrogenase
MKILHYNDKTFANELDTLCSRSAFTDDVDRSVAEILHAIQKKGNTALIDYARMFDHVDLNSDEFRVPETEISNAESMLDQTTKNAIHLAYENITTFAEKRLPKSWSFSPRKGVLVGERYVPLDRVAAYIPGGNSPLVSTVIHTVAIAKAAGVGDIVVTTPPGKNKKIHPGILYASSVSGATEVFRLGGVYGIGAMAYGTETIQKVEKIVGPGNAFVTAAKRIVYGHVALDLVAGPSEIMIIADESANPEFIAADMLAQAEHGSGREMAMLISTSDDIIQNVREQLETQSKARDRFSAMQTVIEHGVFLIRVKNIEQAIMITNRIAPEHLEIMTDEAPEKLADQIKAAGAIFLGSWTPEPVGDFVAGPSHVLPTGGAGRFFSGLTVDQFFRKISIVKYDKDALSREAEAIRAFSKVENLDAHGHSVDIRLED